MSEFFDENLNYIGPTASQAGFDRAARNLNRNKNQPRIEMGRNSHHAMFRRICTDQNLYRAGLLNADECHPDCDLSILPDQLSMARDFLSLNGVAIPDSLSPLQVIKRANSTSDFPELMADTANRAATLGYSSAPEIWPMITRTTHNKNFLPFSRITAPEMPVPGEVGENGEIQHAQLGSDSAETGQIISWAELIKTSRELSINNDLAAITTTPFEAGRAVSRKIGDLVFAVLNDNSAMADSVALFHSTRANLVDTGSGGAPSISTLDALRALMAAQTGTSGEVLNIRARYLLGPVGMESNMATVRDAQNAPSPGEASTGYISTLTDSRLTGTVWYALADPGVHDCIQVVLLEGDTTPLRFERRKSNADGTEFLVGVDAEVLPVDYRSIAKNAGA